MELALRNIDIVSNIKCVQYLLRLNDKQAVEWTTHYQLDCSVCRRYAL